MQLNKEIKDYVKIYDNIYSEDLCDAIINEYPDKEYIPAKTGDGLSPHLRHVDEIGISLPENNNSKIRHDLLNALHYGMSKVIKQYQTSFPYFYIEMDTGFQLLKYKTGHYYKQHVDTFRPVVDQNLINTILDMKLTPEDLLKFHGSGQRALSCSIQLNNDFEGGELALWDRDYIVKIPKGSVLVFPSNFMYPHEVLEITKGTRHAIVTWLI
tara:strand:- start:652 stop:1287 length:636 start_codon:yes stop_codon:yes gene_type:complete